MLTGLLRRNVSGAFANASSGARSGFAAAAALACAVALSAPALATEITDPKGDILATFSGNHNAADLDVTSASVTFSNNTFHLSASVAGDVRATTPNALYVWGIDRGHGTAVLNQGATPVGSGVTFDSVVVFVPGGAILSQIDKDGLFGPVTALSPTIVGNTLSVDVTLDQLRALPGTDPDFDVEGFLFNFWPRLGANVKDGTEVSDFVPGGVDGVGSTFTVPEPGALTLMIGGVGLAGAMRRRRSATTASSA